MAVTLVLLAAGCHNSTQATPWCQDPRADVLAEGAPTWHQDIKPLFFQHCARCHQPGSIGPLPLLTYQDVAGVAESIRTMVNDRRMPPWKGNPCCGKYQHDTSLTDLEVATIRTWVNNGAPEGDGTPDPAVGQPRGLSRVDLTLGMPEPYSPTPQQGTADDTRCFLLDWPESEGKFVTGLNVKPGNAAVVHHVLVLVANAVDIPALQRADDHDDGPGWSCPGGLVGAYGGYLGGWAPGFEATELPEGLGHEVRPHSKIVLTVHYSMPAMGSLGPDQTALELKMQSSRTRVVTALDVYDSRWPYGGMKIPANQKDVTFTYRFTPSHYTGLRYELFSASLHMHERGDKGRLMILRQDGSTECLLQVDQYDHHWQGEFTFDQPKILYRGDELYVECVFDNTASHQRVVFGQREDPADLNWGEQKEMCVGFVTSAPVYF